MRNELEERDMSPYRIREAGQGGKGGGGKAETNQGAMHTLVGLVD
jgi:hypothetical protein